MLDSFLKLEPCITELEIDDLFKFIVILMILTKYAFMFAVLMTEFSITVGSLTLIFCSVMTKCKLNHTFPNSLQ